jgi:multidrug transporter EmrE-like cation transporter
VLVISGYGMLGISMLISVVCYSGLEYMQVVIIEPIGYVIVMFLSRFFFGEKITARKIIGMAILLAGIIVFYLN